MKPSFGRLWAFPVVLSWGQSVRPLLFGIIASQGSVRTRSVVAEVGNLRPRSISEAPPDLPHSGLQRRAAPRCELLGRNGRRATGQ